MQKPASNSHAPKKSLGQHFLNNPRIGARMVEAANLRADSTVLEIGPGRGFLTAELLKTGAHVYAIETDPRMVEILTDTFKKELADGQLSLVEQDVRSLDLADLNLKNQKYTVVANIPYFLSGYLFRFFLTIKRQPKTLVFLVQKEIAERIAREQKSSLLSLSVRAYGVPEYVQTVRPGSFTPPPKVTSAIVKIGEISRNNFKTVNEAFFFELLHLGFAAKRKQLLGALAKQFDRSDLVHIFSTLGLSKTVRGEDLNLKTWLKLTRTLDIHK